MVPFDQIKTLKFTIKTPFTLKRNNSYKKESSKKNTVVTLQTLMANHPLPPLFLIVKNHEKRADPLTRLYVIIERPLFLS